MNFRHIFLKLFKQGHNSRGFTLIELMVVVGIFMLITGVLLADYPLFSHKVSIQNLAHQMALTIRQAQVYGLSVRESSTGSAAFPGFGVYFSANDRTAFILYTDIDKDKKYDGTFDCSTSPECLEKITIANGDLLRDICGVTAGGTPHCANSAALDSLNIVFVRPDPDANLIGTFEGGDTTYARAEVSVEPPQKDFFNTIIIWSTGQITIQPPVTL